MARMGTKTYARNQSRGCKKSWTPERREQHSDYIKVHKRYYDENGNEISMYEANKEAILKTRKSPEFREKMSKIMKKKWATKKHRRKLVKAIRKFTQTEEFKKKVSEATKKRYASDKEYRKKIKKICKKMRKNRKLNLRKKDLKRINDYCGVITQSDFEELMNE